MVSCTTNTVLSKLKYCFITWSISIGRLCGCGGVSRSGHGVDIGPATDGGAGGTIFFLLILFCIISTLKWNCLTEHLNENIILRDILNSYSPRKAFFAWTMDSYHYFFAWVRNIPMAPSNDNNFATVSVSFSASLPEILLVTFIFLQFLFTVHHSPLTGSFLSPSIFC